MEQNRKRLLVLFLLLLFIGTALFIPSYLPSIVSETNKPLFSLTDENLRGFVITGNMKNHVLEKDKNTWIVKKDNRVFAADLDKITRLTDVLNHLSKETIVSENKKKHVLFGIDKKKITVQTTAGEKTLYIGKYYAGNALYTRIGNEDQVFLGEGLGELNLDDDYRDLDTHFIASKETIESILIESPGANTILSKRGKEWFSGDVPASVKKLDQFLNDISTLQASDILPDEKKLQPTGESFSITAKGKNFTTYILFVPSDDKSYKVQSSNSSLTYIVANVYVASLQKNSGDFLE